MTKWLAGMRVTAGMLNDKTSHAAGATFTPAVGICTLNSFTDQVTPGGTYIMYLSVNYTGSTLTGSATGNTADTVIGTLSGTPNLPPIGITVLARGNISAGTANEWGCQISSTGDVKIEAIPATGTIKSGDVLSVSASWAAG